MIERKVSDVILSLERDVKEMKALLKNQDMLLKLLLKGMKSSNVDVLSQPRDQIDEKRLVNDTTQGNKVIQAKPLIPGLKPGVVMGPQGLHNKVETEDDYEFPEVKSVVNNAPIELKESYGEDEIVGQRRTNRYNSDGNIVGRPVPVRQKILYPDGKLVCMAGVEIFDMESGSSVAKIRTSATGEWNTSLKPGQYQVQIIKAKALNKPEVKLTFGIDIPSGSSGILELPTPEN